MKRKIKEYGNGTSIMRVPVTPKPSEYDIYGSALELGGTGASMGSAFGPIGTAIGAGVGGIIGLAQGQANYDEQEKRRREEMNTNTYANTQNQQFGYSEKPQFMGGIDATFIAEDGVDISMKKDVPKRFEVEANELALAYNNDEIVLMKDFAKPTLDTSTGKTVTPKSHDKGGIPQGYAEYQAMKEKGYNIAIIPKNERGRILQRMQTYENAKQKNNSDVSRTMYNALRNDIDKLPEDFDVEKRNGTRMLNIEYANGVMNLLMPKNETMKRKLSTTSTLTTTIVPKNETLEDLINQNTGQGSDEIGRFKTLEGNVEKGIMFDENGNYVGGGAAFGKKSMRSVENDNRFKNTLGIDDDKPYVNNIRFNKAIEDELSFRKQVNEGKISLDDYEKKVEGFNKETLSSLLALNNQIEGAVKTTNDNSFWNAGNKYAETDSERNKLYWENENYNNTGVFTPYEVIEEKFNNETKNGNLGQPFIPEKTRGKVTNTTNNSTNETQQQLSFTPASTVNSAMTTENNNNTATNNTSAAQITPTTTNSTLQSTTPQITSTTNTTSNNVVGKTYEDYKKLYGDNVLSSIMIGDQLSKPIPNEDRVAMLKLYNEKLAQQGKPLLKGEDYRITNVGSQTPVNPQTTTITPQTTTATILPTPPTLAINGTTTTNNVGTNEIPVVNNMQRIMPTLPSNMSSNTPLNKTLLNRFTPSEDYNPDQVLDGVAPFVPNVENPEQVIANNQNIVDIQSPNYVEDIFRPKTDLTAKGKKTAMPQMSEQLNRFGTSVMNNLAALSNIGEGLFSNPEVETAQRYESRPYEYMFSSQPMLQQAKDMATINAYNVGNNAGGNAQLANALKQQVNADLVTQTNQIYTPEVQNAMSIRNMNTGQNNQNVQLQNQENARVNDINAANRAALRNIGRAGMGQITQYNKQTTADDYQRKQIETQMANQKTAQQFQLDLMKDIVPNYTVEYETVVGEDGVTRQVPKTTFKKKKTLPTETVTIKPKE